MFDAQGESGFSVRKLGSQMGVDPMTVLHHFKSKDELLRRIADKALELVGHREGRWGPSGGGASAA